MISLQAKRPVMMYLFLFLACAGDAKAGDVAERHILGFSPDGDTFAFEQFGVQDGSGFPYSDIFMIDTASDKWVDGSPFRVLLREERAQPKWARRDALTKAGNLLRERVISNPGRLLASNPPAELSAQPYQVVVNANPVQIAPPERWTFSLQEMTFKNPRCTAFASEDVKGFKLTMQKDGQASRTLHVDKSLPKSRGCALRYAISDIIIHEPRNGKRIFAILVSVYAHGFEGPDRRFLAVTAQVP